MFKKIISILLIFILVGSFVVSCKKDNGPTDDGTPQDSVEESESEDTPELSYEILVSELANYAVIYPEDANDSLKNAANDLVNTLSKSYGIIISSKNDNPVNFKGESQVGEYEIIIGDTRREESKTLLSQLEYNDRGYMIIGKKIVIAAHDSFTTASLVFEFSSMVRSQKKNATVFFDSSMNKIYRGTYKYGTITVGDVDISKFSIVYSAGNNFEKALAQKLWRAIAEECGSMLNVISDSEPATQYEMIIGTGRSTRPTELNSAAAEAGYAAIAGSTVILSGNSALGKSAAVESLISGFKNGTASDVHRLTAAGGLVYDTGSASSMSFNLTADGMNDARARRVVETIVRYLPDTVGLQECSAEWKAILLSELGDYYGYIGTGRDAQGTGLATAVLYAKDKFTVKDSGTKWLSYTPDVSSRLGGADANYTYTYAVLERANGEQLMVLNTQLCKTAAVRNEQATMLLDFMYGHKDKAIIFTAALGCAENSEAFNTLVCEFMRHAAAICSIEKLGSVTHATITDTVLVYDKYIDVSYMEVASARIDGDYASKSNAAYIEYVINMDGTDFTESGTSDDKLTVVPDRDGENYLPVDPAK